MPDLKKVLAANLKALMDSDEPPRSERAIALKAGVHKNTINRMLNPTPETNYPAVDTLEAIAHVWKLQAWQMLIPDLDPANAPTIIVSQAEREWQERMKTLARELPKLDGQAATQSSHRKHGPRAPLPAASAKRRRTRVP